MEESAEEESNAWVVNGIYTRGSVIGAVIHIVIVVVRFVRALFRSQQSDSGVEF